MSWFKVDDQLHAHPKILAIPIRDRYAALGLWVVAGSYASAYLTDGHVPAALVDDTGTRRQAETLVKAGLWQVEPDGYRFHDWKEYQPLAAEVEAERAQARARKRRQRRRDDDGTTP